MDFSQALAAGSDEIIRKQHKIFVGNLGFASRPRSRGFDHLSGKRLYDRVTTVTCFEFGHKGIQ